MFSSVLPRRRAVVACVDPERAPITRSNSPSLAAIRRASSGGCWPSASMMSTKSPFARRIPVFTAAPFPLLYGCRTTHAPAARAFADVSSVEPSSTTRTSRHGAVERMDETTVPIASASFIAGMTIDTLEGSAKQLLDHAVPRDRLREFAASAAQPLGERPVGIEPVDRRGERRGRWLADEPVDAIPYELQRTAGIGRGDHWFAREK